MQKPTFIAGLLLALAAAPYSPAQLLPAHFGTWSRGHCVDKPATTLLAMETGQRDNDSCQFFSHGHNSVVVWAGSFRDPSSAYEVYTSWINPAMQPSAVGGYSAIDHDKLLMLVGNVIARVEKPLDIPIEDLRQLVDSMSAHSEQTPLPPIRAFLPKDFTDGTQRYTLGPMGFEHALIALKREQFAGLTSEAGFASGAEAMLAEYRKGNDSAVVLLIEYPTPQLAEQHLRHLEQALSPAAKQAGTTIERNASLLTLVLEPSSKTFGDALRGAVNYETSVTWNQPTHTITDPPWLVILSRIFLATGLFMVVAVVLGVAFGGVRVIAKIFFPGKFFDRPEQMDVLQLGLSSKRIDSRDFY
jgi:hypothetical protein